MRIKICGLTREEDALAAAAAGAHHLGAVLIPSSPRCVSPARAAEVARAARGRGRGAGGDEHLPLTLVLADLAPEAMAQAAEVAGAAALQLHGDENEETVRRLRGLGEWELWKAVRVRSGDQILDAARRWGGKVDLLLLDGWHPDRLGGTGTPFPWEALERARARWPDGLGLGIAGGLRPGNVGEAIRRLSPDLVDVSSGVEARPGVKDPKAIRAFVEEAMSAGSRSGRAG